MADLILGKQERLAKMREQKRKRDAEKKAKQDALTGGMSGSVFGADGRANISNAFIDQILRDEDPFAPKEEQKVPNIEFQIIEKKVQLNLDKGDAKLRRIVNPWSEKVSDII